MAESILAWREPRAALCDTIDLATDGLRQVLALLDAIAIAPSASLADIGREIARDHLELLDAERAAVALCHVTAPAAARVTEAPR